MKTISGRYDLEVTTEVSRRDLMLMKAQGKDAQKTWYRMAEHDPKTKKMIREYVHLPDKFEMSDNAARGAAAHEAGHVRITRFGEFVPDDLMQKIGFHSLIAAVEERPTDQVVREIYPGAGVWVDEVREHLLEESEENFESTSVATDKIPRFQQFCNLIVFEPHHAKGKILPSCASKEVLDAYESVRGSIERIEKTVPADKDDEEKILKIAKDRYGILYKEVWPLMQELIAKDIEDEKLRKITESDSTADLENLKKLLESLPEEMQIEFQAAIQKKIIEELSEQLRKAVLEFFDSLPEEEKNEIIAQIQKKFEEREDEIVLQLAGKFSDSPETHAKVRIEKKAAEERKIEEEKNKAEMEKIDKNLKGIQEELGVYEEVYRQVHELDEQLFARLEEIFVPNIKHKVLMRSSGTRINISKIYKWESARKSGAKSLDNKIFESYHRPEKADYAITLLVDLSSSMILGDKIKETFKAVVLLAEVLNRLGIKTEILGFQDEIIPFKSFDEELSDEIRVRMSGMLMEVKNKNPGGRNKSGDNYDGPCLRNASARLAAQASKESFLMVFSDGFPTGPYDAASGKGAQEILIETVNAILQLGDQKIIGLGLGTGTEHVEKFYPVSLPNIDVEKMVEVLGELIEDLIVSPEKYSFVVEK